MINIRSYKGRGRQVGEGRDSFSSEFSSKNIMSCFLFLSRSRSRLHDQSSNVTVCFVSYTECNVFVYFITCLKILNILDPTEKKNVAIKWSDFVLFCFPSKVCVLCFSSASQLVINISFKNLTSLQLESMYKRFLQSSLVCVCCFVFSS